MATAMISYRVAPEALDEHLALLAAVYRELRERSPARFRYATFQLPQPGAFLDLVSAPTLPGPLPELEAFRRYRRGLEQRCEQREFAELQLFDSYGGD